MSLKAVRKGWAAFWTKDPHRAAACSFCGKPRASVAFLVEGPTAYICDECAILSVAICAQHENANPTDVGFRALAGMIEGIGVATPYARLEPLLVAMLGLATSTAGRETAHRAAARFGHWELALRALSSIPAEERAVAAKLDIAAMCINLERFEAAAEALDALPGVLDDEERLFAACHRAVLAAHTKALLGDDEVHELVVRARALGKPALVKEALEALARHRAANADTAGALATVDEAMTLGENAPLLLLRGDLLAPNDEPGAREAWRRSLELAHPDGIDAQRARARLEAQRTHPYRQPP